MSAILLGLFPSSSCPGTPHSRDLTLVKFWVILQAYQIPSDPQDFEKSVSPDSSLLSTPVCLSGKFLFMPQVSAEDSLPLWSLLDPPTTPGVDLGNISSRLTGTQRAFPCLPLSLLLLLHSLSLVYKYSEAWSSCVVFLAWCLICRFSINVC